jgi:hypothetical protein
MVSASGEPGAARPAVLSTMKLLVGGLLDQVFDDVVRFVDVLQRATTQSMGKVVTLSLQDVMMRLVKQLQGAMIPAFVSEVRIDRGVIVQILPIINRGLLDFADGFIDLCNGVIFFSIHAAGPSPTFQMSSGVAQIGKGVQVCGMPTWLISKGQCGTDSNQKHDYGTMSYSLHILSSSRPFGRMELGGVTQNCGFRLAAF